MTVKRIAYHGQIIWWAMHVIMMPSICTWSIISSGPTHTWKVPRIDSIFSKAMQVLRPMHTCTLWKYLIITTKTLQIIWLPVHRPPRILNHRDQIEPEVYILSILLPGTHWLVFVQWIQWTNLWQHISTTFLCSHQHSNASSHWSLSLMGPISYKLVTKEIKIALDLLQIKITNVYLDPVFRVTSWEFLVQAMLHMQEMGQLLN